MKVGVVPFYNGQYENKLFDISNQEMNADNALMPYYEIRNAFGSNGVELMTVDMCEHLEEFDCILFFRLEYDILMRCLKANVSKLIYFAWEPEVVDKRHSVRNLKKISSFFDAIMTWNDDIVDNKKFFKINYSYYFSKTQIACDEDEFKKKKLLVNISGNKKSHHPNELYSERFKVIEYYENKQTDEFELYGGIWPARLKCLKGRCHSKSDVYSRFRFALCLENMCHVNGYITEKIFDCFMAGIVPIYWGASNIDQYIPKKCFVDYKRFNSLDELNRYISLISYGEYKMYIDAIILFLNSNCIKPFTADFFVRSLQNVICLQDANRCSNSLLLNYYRWCYVFKAKLKKVFVR